MIFARRIPFARWAGISLKITLCWIVAGCRSAPEGTSPPLEAPAIKPTVVHRAGSPLAKPAARSIDAGADALNVQVQWWAMDAVPESIGGSLAPRAQLIAIPTASAPIATAAPLVGAARLVEGAEVKLFVGDVEAGRFGRVAEIGVSRGALPADVTATFDLKDAGGELGLAVYRPAAGTNGEDRIQLGVVISEAPRRERALLEPMPLENGATRLAIVMPSRFDNTASRATLAVIEVSRETGPEHAEALAQCARELAQDLPAATQPAMARSSEWSGLAAALAALTARSDANTARPALVFLADQTSASLCGDVALVADDSVVSKLAKRIASKVGSDSKSVNKAALGWVLDSACFAELAAMQSADKMPQELRAVLTAYAGEAGRHVASLEEVAKGLQSREQLDAQLIAENMVYLEDASPAARVRAYDWLASKGRAPAGYDPLASNKERRDALDKSLSTAAAAPAAAAQEGGK